MLRESDDIGKLFFEKIFIFFGTPSGSAEPQHGTMSIQGRKTGVTKSQLSGFTQMTNSTFMKLLLFALSLVLLLRIGEALMGQIASTPVTIRPRGDFNSIGSVLKMYKINNGSYPTQTQGLKALVEKPTDFHSDTEWTQLSDRVPLDPWGNPYQYIAPSSYDGEFALFSFGRDGISHSNGNDPDDLNNWSTPKPPYSWIDRFWDNNIPLLCAYALLLFAIISWIRSRIIRSKSKI